MSPDSVIHPLSCPRSLISKMLSRISLLPLVLSISLAVARTKNSKRGIGFSSTVPGDLINANQSNSLISWQYNWGSLPPDYIATSNIPYVPMQWGSAAIDGFSSTVKILGSNTILVCHISPATTAC